MMHMLTLTLQSPMHRSMQLLRLLLLRRLPQKPRLLPTRLSLKPRLMLRPL